MRYFIHKYEVPSGHKSVTQWRVRTDEAQAKELHLLLGGEMFEVEPVIDDARLVLIESEVADFFAGMLGPGAPDIESGAAQRELLVRLRACIIENRAK